MIHAVIVAHSRDPRLCAAEVVVFVFAGMCVFVHIPDTRTKQYVKKKRGHTKGSCTE